MQWPWWERLVAVGVRWSGVWGEGRVKEGSPVGSEQVGARRSPQRDRGPEGDVQDREDGVVVG